MSCRPRTRREQRSEHRVSGCQEGVRRGWGGGGRGRATQSPWQLSRTERWRETLTAEQGKTARQGRRGPCEDKAEWGSPVLPETPRYWFGWSVGAPGMWDRMAWVSRSHPSRILYRILRMFDSVWQWGHESLGAFKQRKRTWSSSCFRALSLWPGRGFGVRDLSRVQSLSCVGEHGQGEDTGSLRGVEHIAAGF